jgi:trehalose 6-phosphate synthase/phosphatase
VASHTASYWATAFLSEFAETIQSKPCLSKLPPLNIKKVVTAYERAKTRLIISDYDGTLMKNTTLPQLAQPANALVEMLRTLSQDPKNTVIIMSGRERRFLESWLGKLKVGLAAEYGFYHRMPGEEEWASIGEEIELSWKELVSPIMMYFTERTPGTYIESKESSLVRTSNSGPGSG